MSINKTGSSPQNPNNPYGSARKRVAGKETGKKKVWSVRYAQPNKPTNTNTKQASTATPKANPVDYGQALRSLAEKKGKVGKKISQETITDHLKAQGIKQPVLAYAAEESVPVLNDFAKTAGDNKKQLNTFQASDDIRQALWTQQFNENVTSPLSTPTAKPGDKVKKQRIVSDIGECLSEVQGPFSEGRPIAYNSTIINPSAIFSYNPSCASEVEEDDIRIPDTLDVLALGLHGSTGKGKPYQQQAIEHHLGGYHNSHAKLQKAQEEYIKIAQGINKNNKNDDLNIDLFGGKKRPSDLATKIQQTFQYGDEDDLFKAFSNPKFLEILDPSIRREIRDGLQQDLDESNRINNLPLRLQALDALNSLR